MTVLWKAMSHEFLYWYLLVSFNHVQPYSTQADFRKSLRLNKSSCRLQLVTLIVTPQFYIV